MFFPGHFGTKNDKFNHNIVGNFGCDRAKSRISPTKTGMFIGTNMICLSPSHKLSISAPVG